MPKLVKRKSNPKDHSIKLPGVKSKFCDLFLKKIVKLFCYEYLEGNGFKLLIYLLDPGGILNNLRFTLT